MSIQIGAVDLDVTSLRTARKKARLTQREVADLIGGGVQNVYRWENGIRTPDATMLLRLSMLYGVRDMMDWVMKSDPSDFHLPANITKRYIITSKVKKCLVHKRRERQGK